MTSRGVDVVPSLRPRRWLHAWWPRNGQPEDEPAEENTQPIHMAGTNVNNEREWGAEEQQPVRNGTKGTENPGELTCAVSLTTDAKSKETS